MDGRLQGKRGLIRGQVGHSPPRSRSWPGKGRPQRGKRTGQGRGHLPVGAGSPGGLRASPAALTPTAGQRQHRPCTRPAARPPPAATRPALGSTGPASPASRGERRAERKGWASPQRTRRAGWGWGWASPQAAGQGLRPADLESRGRMSPGVTPPSAGLCFRNPACSRTPGGPLALCFHPGPPPPPPASHHLPRLSSPFQSVGTPPTLGLEEARQSPEALGVGGGHERLRPGRPWGHGGAWESLGGHGAGQEAVH